MKVPPFQPVLEDRQDSAYIRPPTFPGFPSALPRSNGFRPRQNLSLCPPRPQGTGWGSYALFRSGHDATLGLKGHLPHPHMANPYPMACGDVVLGNDHGTGGRVQPFLPLRKFLPGSSRRDPSPLPPLAQPSRLRHLLTHHQFTCAIATGAATGILVAIFTELVTTWLPQLLPFLRRRPHPAKHRAAQQTTTTTTATAAATAATTKPRRPAPRHVASAVYWSSDEEADGLDRHVTFIPPSRRHGYSPKKPLPPSSAGPSTTSSSAWSTSSSSRGSRHRAPQQPVKARVAVADIIHEESSVSERELPVLRSSTRGR
ncbi:hypothetical protein B0I37DRAFT_121835 [Chaetomium sp. MPI-CAGE-AT-0009]|nr:hypothetical protein B0I37DRAFT_121835 [Chaetomium sp. MPI-CAGE-AT-0009]